MKISLKTVCLNFLSLGNAQQSSKFRTIRSGPLYHNNGRVRNTRTCEVELSESVARVRAKGGKQADGLVCKDRAMRQI